MIHNAYNLANDNDEHQWSTDMDKKVSIIETVHAIHNGNYFSWHQPNQVGQPITEKNKICYTRHDWASK